MEAVCFQETGKHLQMTRHYIPEDHSLNTCCFIFVVYLSALSVTQTILRQMTACLMNDEFTGILEKMVAT
jgi:hypothetical protein